MGTPFSRFREAEKRERERSPETSDHAPHSLACSFCYLFFFRLQPRRLLLSAVPSLPMLLLSPSLLSHSSAVSFNDLPDSDGNNVSKSSGRDVQNWSSNSCVPLLVAVPCLPGLAAIVVAKGVGSLVAITRLPYLNLAKCGPGAAYRSANSL